MREIGVAIKLLKLSATGVLATILGVAQMATGDREGMIGGAGSLLVAVVVFGFIAYGLFHKVKLPETEAEQLPRADERSGLLRLGIMLSVAPGLLYLYLYYAGYHFPFVALVLGIPILIGGLACIAVSLWPVVGRGPS